MTFFRLLLEGCQVVEQDVQLMIDCRDSRMQVFEPFDFCLERGSGSIVWSTFLLGGPVPSTIILVVIILRIMGGRVCAISVIRGFMIWCLLRFAVMLVMILDFLDPMIVIVIVMLLVVALVGLVWMFSVTGGVYLFALLKLVNYE